MREKIINIRNILKIIISLFVIFTMVKSCSKAYTFDEFVEYCQQVKDGDITTTDRVKTLCTYLLNNETRIRNATNVNNYKNFVISEGTYIYFSMNNGCKVQQVSASSTNLKLNNVITPKWRLCFKSKFN